MSVLHILSALLVIYLHVHNITAKVILFLTDGDPGEGKTTILDSIDRLNAKLRNAVSIFTFGIGRY